MRSVWWRVTLRLQGHPPPQPPLQHRGALSWGWRWETGTEDSPLPRGSWLVGRQRRHGARASPRHPHNLGRGRRGQVPAPPGKRGGGCSSFLPDASPRTVHLRGSGAGWGRHPPNHTQKQAKAWACAPPQPHSPDKGAKGEVRGAAGVKITDPFIKGKKAKIQKKKEKS